MSDKILITNKRVEEVKKYIRSFLDQKAKLDNKIRDYNVTKIDLYKEILLEDYLSGMLVMLRAIGMKYTIDDKQITFDIEFSNLEQEYDTPDEEIRHVFAVLKNSVQEKINTFDEVRNEIDQRHHEQKLLKNFYALFGAQTIVNKFGLKFYSKFIDDKTQKTINQIYINDEEVDDYITMEEKINNITDLAFQKITLQEAINVLIWKKTISSNENKLSGMLFQKVANLKIENFDEKIKELEKRKQVLELEAKNFEDMIVDIQEKIILANANHRELIYNFANEYLKIEESNE